MTHSNTRTVTRLSRAARRAQLVDAARSVLTAKGFHATSMDDIAEAAGVSKPVLYQHFPSKLELYLELLTESAASVVALVREESRAPRVDNRDRVYHTLATYFDFVSERQQSFRFVFESDLQGEPAVDAIVNQARSDCIDALAETLIESADLGPGRARLLASGLVGLSQMSALFWLREGGDVPREEAIALLSRLVWRGISRFPRSPESPAGGPDQA